MSACLQLQRAPTEALQVRQRPWPSSCRGARELEVRQQTTAAVGRGWAPTVTIFWVPRHSGSAGDGTSGIRQDQRFPRGMVYCGTAPLWNICCPPLYNHPRSQPLLPCLQTGFCFPHLHFALRLSPLHLLFLLPKPTQQTVLLLSSPQLGRPFSSPDHAWTHSPPLLLPHLLHNHPCILSTEMGGETASSHEPPRKIPASLEPNCLATAFSAVMRLYGSCSTAHSLGMT